MRYGWAAIGLGAAIAVAIAASRMRWPVLGTVSSKFGWRTHPLTGVESFHNGVDIEAPTGTPVRAPFEGVVESVYWNDAGGNAVILQLANGYRAGFAHLNSVAVAQGASVGKGVVIGTVGATGAVTGPHLHYTLKKDGDWVDPETIHAA